MFAAFLVCHMAGDYLLQTDWQAVHKRGGMGRDPVALRALATHVFTYTLAFAPALVWIGADVGLWAIGIAAAIAVPHFVIDDGRLLQTYVAAVKGPGAAANHTVMRGADQATHAICLLGTALLAVL